MRSTLLFLVCFVLLTNAQFYPEGYPERNFFNVDEPRDGQGGLRNNYQTAFEQRLYRHISEMESRITQLERQIVGLQMAAHSDWNQTDSGSMYKLFEERKNWEDAEATCQSFDAHLAVVDNEIKNKFINSLIKDVPTADFAWIGMRTKTTTPEQLDSFSNFAAESPINGCAVMDKSGVWSIRSCGQLRPFICQKILARQ